MTFVVSKTGSRWVGEVLCRAGENITVMLLIGRRCGNIVTVRSKDVLEFESEREAHECIRT